MKDTLFTLSLFFACGAALLMVACSVLSLIRGYAFGRQCRLEDRPLDFNELYQSDAWPIQRFFSIGAEIFAWLFFLLMLAWEIAPGA